MNKIYLQFSLKRDVKGILTKTCQGAYQNDGFLLKISWPKEIVLKSQKTWLH